MLLRVNCEIAFKLPQQTAMALMLYLHPSVASRVRSPERLTAVPNLPVSEYADLYGNRCGRVLVPAGAAFTTFGVNELDSLRVGTSEVFAQARTLAARTPSLDPARFPSASFHRGEEK